MKTNKFTLIELLTVISVIAILVSMLLPSLSRSRAKTKQMACLGNLKKLGVANALYLKDNNQGFPFITTRRSVEENGFIAWDKAYLPYITGNTPPAPGILLNKDLGETSQSYVCPGSTLQNSPLPDGKVIQSYAMPGHYNYSRDAIGTTWKYWIERNMHPRKSHQVGDPSRTILLTERERVNAAHNG